MVSYKESSGTDSDEVVERREQQLEVEEDNREAIERVLKKRIGKVGGESARALLFLTDDWSHLSFISQSLFPPPSLSSLSPLSLLPPFSPSLLSLPSLPILPLSISLPLLLSLFLVLPAETGNKTTCYGGGSASPAGREGATEVQYLVKWLNWSHLHNTWETGEARLETDGGGGAVCARNLACCLLTIVLYLPSEQGLLEMNVKGMKRFYNFLKREEERETWEREANPEDIEYVKCQEELQDQLLEHVTQVERVIG